MHLREGKYFECSCKRCLDPTEFNTEMSSMKCRKCKGIIRMNVRGKNWKCNKCEKIFSHSLITSTLNEARSEMELSGKSSK